jgi:hypothetical protein
MADTEEKSKQIEPEEKKVEKKTKKAKKDEDSGDEVDYDIDEEDEEIDAEEYAHHLCHGLFYRKGCSNGLPCPYRRKSLRFGAKPPTLVPTDPVLFLSGLSHSELDDPDELKDLEDDDDANLSPEELRAKYGYGQAAAEEDEEEAEEEAEEGAADSEGTYKTLIHLYDMLILRQVVKDAQKISF